MSDLADAAGAARTGASADAPPAAKAAATATPALATPSTGVTELRRAAPPAPAQAPPTAALRQPPAAAPALAPAAGADPLSAAIQALASRAGDDPAIAAWHDRLRDLQRRVVGPWLRDPSTAADPGEPVPDGRGGILGRVQVDGTQLRWTSPQGTTWRARLQAAAVHTPAPGSR